jgi:hypothetical protein
MPYTHQSVTSVVAMLISLFLSLVVPVSKVSAEGNCVGGICISTTSTTDAEVIAEVDGAMLKAFLQTDGYTLLRTDMIVISVTEEIAQANNMASSYKLISSVYKSQPGDIAYLTFWENGSNKHVTVSTGDLNTYAVKGNSVELISREEAKSFFPELLHSIPNPIDHVVVKEVKDDYSAASQCRTVQAHVEQRSVTGTSRLFLWWQEKYWCYDGTNMSNINVQAYATDISVNVNYQGVADSVDRNCTSSAIQCHESRRTGKFEVIIPSVGPWSYLYPWVSITSGGNGYYVVGTGGVE